MPIQIKLPTSSGKLVEYTLTGKQPSLPKNGTQFNRIAYSAAHVVSNPLANVDPWIDCAIDWEATIAYRERLWSLGLGVAEAMDTAQRGMGLDWSTSLELIKRSIDASKNYPGSLIASGCGTDHLNLDEVTTVDQVIAAYDLQMEAIEKLGGKLIIMASRALTRVAKGEEDYERVYDHILTQASEPVILHWLGDMFDPALSGYWGSHDTVKATDTVIGIINAHSTKVDGIKISLLEKDKEIQARRQLPSNGGVDGAGVRMYTGDDFNYAELIAGDGVGASDVNRKSDALLGIFDAIAPAASAALSELASGNIQEFHNILGPTVPLSRHIFKSPTRFYKTGVVFMSWLGGHQSHFSMIGGQQSSRSLMHFVELFKLADQANLLEDPELAVSRLKMLLSIHGI